MTDIPQDSKRCEEKKCSKVAVHLLITLFGISAWIGTNGIFIQTPVLIDISPESWALAAYLVLIIQAANFGPLFYTVLQQFKCKINESWWILCLLVLGTLAMGLLSFLYSERTVIAGNEYSLVLFILTFFNALVGCFSSVLFMPYLRNFKENYLTSYFIGEGLSGVLPSIVALVQGIEDSSECTTFTNDTRDSFDSNLKFSSNHYFLFIFVILCLSLTAFVILEYSLLVQNKKKHHKSLGTISNEKEINISHNHYTEDVPRHCSLEEDSFLHNHKCLTKQMQNYLFILLAILCFFSNGFLPSIQSYSCLPYGNTAYKLSVTFAQFANPLVCLLAFWLKISSIKIVNYLSLICLIIGSYAIYLAMMSPAPPLQKTTLGVVLVVMSWTILIGFISYLKLIIVSIFRRTVLPRILFNVGVIMQIGSASGAIFSFLIINFTNIFEMHNNCTLTDN
ncbi:solute carrier family 52, riboflavin transporter, member 3-A [Osmia lignaria lignaria]|uniref:solute carrier family 52, riboflavin transporter, member 3-A n=1 Tax=Osmia lignaria lignaria TaxID=1437193 RepID=UPI00402B6138